MYFYVVLRLTGAEKLWTDALVITYLSMRADIDRLLAMSTSREAMPLQWAKIRRMVKNSETSAANTILENKSNMPTEKRKPEMMQRQK